MLKKLRRFVIRLGVGPFHDKWMCTNCGAMTPDHDCFND